MDLDLLNDIDSSPQESRREFPNPTAGSPDVILNAINSSLLEGPKEFE